MDDAGAFTGVSMSGSAIAQDWRTRKPNGRRRTSISVTWSPAQLQYTSGVGVSGGGMMDGGVGEVLQRLDDHESADGGQRPAAHAGRI